MIFEKLYQELSHSTKMIRALIAGISQEDAKIKPAPKTWSTLEVICHLYDEEREDFREHLDFILHRQNEDWHPIDPQGWVTSRKYNKQNFIQMQEKFLAERKISLKWLKGLSDANWDTLYTSEYGSISARQMLAAWIAHDNLHIRQLVELRRHRIEQMNRPSDLNYAGDW